MTRLLRIVRIYPALLRIGFAEALAYRVEFFVWLLATTMPLVMLALWVAVARDAPVGAFDQAGFVAYFLAVLIVRMLTGCWVVWQLVMEIRQGTLVQRLLRPIHPVWAYSAEQLAALPLRALVALPIAVGLLVSSGSERLATDPALLGLFVVSLLGAWMLNFLSMLAIGTLAFFIESAFSIFALWMTFTSVFSGYLVPLSLFPDWLRAVGDALPFRFLVSYPVEILTGQLSGARALVLLGHQWLWVAGLGLAAGLLWRAGRRRFSAYGG